MSDARLREAERRFATTGSVADEAALLRERLRLGAITTRGVEIALNCLGYPAAFAVLGGENDTWEYWRPDRLPDEIDGMMTQLAGVRLPLGALIARPFALEMASLLDEAFSDRLRERRIRPYINLAKSLDGGHKLEPTTQQQAEALECLEVAGGPRGADGVYEVQLMFAVIVFASAAERAPLANLQHIFRLFLRNSSIVGHKYVTRHYWARRAILRVAIPHLIGHASMVPHSEHLHDAKRRIPPERWRDE